MQTPDQENKGTVRHQVSGEIRRITLDELAALTGNKPADTSGLLLRLKRENPSLEGVVVFEDLELRMPTKKHPLKPIKVIMYGETFTVNPSNLSTAFIGEVPSQFMYPTKIHLLDRPNNNQAHP